MPILETTFQARRYTVNFFNGEAGNDSLAEGDVVVFDSTDPTKVLKTTSQNNEDVIGVVYGDTTSEGELVTVVTMGIATVKVTGAVAKGDILVTSTTAGRAIVAASGHQVGRAITTNASGEATVSAIVSSGVITGSLTDHSVLSNLTVDDHTQYVQKTGRSGGQVIIGGTGSGDDLTFQTTSNGTKGSYIFSELSTAGVLINNASGVVTSIAPSTNQVLGQSSGTPQWVNVSTLSVFGDNSTYDTANERLGIENTSPQASIHIGEKALSPNPFSVNDLGIALASDLESVLLALSGAGQASIAMVDNTGAANQRIMQLITNNEETVFRSLNDSYGTVSDNIIYMDHVTGCVSMGTASFSSAAVLTLSSTTKGFLPPKMTSTQRDAIPSPVVGLVIFNTTTDRLEVYADNSATPRWEDMSGAAA